MAYQGQVRIDGAPPQACSIEVENEALVVAPESGEAMRLELADVADLHDDDYTLRLTGHDGSVLELTMLGKAYGQVTAEIGERRDRVLERDLLLRGLGLKDSFPAKLLAGATPVPVEVRLYEDLLVVVPERGLMFGVPYSFVEDVGWDESLYQVGIRTDEGGSVILGHLAKRTQEFRDELARLLDELAARTAETLRALLPGTDVSSLQRLSGLMRDGRAVQQRAVEAVDPALWGRLEEAVAGEGDRRDAYEHLKSLGPPGRAALGVKAVRSAEEDGSGAAATPPTEPDATPRTDRWFFVPLGREGRPANAVAHEVTSEEGHATYLFRLDEAGEVTEDSAARGIARLNRALLLLNFRREPIYLPQEELDASRYRTAFRLLDHLRYARIAFLGRAIHNAGWKGQVDEALRRA